MATEAQKQAEFEEKVTRLFHAWQVLGEFVRRVEESNQVSGTLDAKWVDIYRGLLDAVLTGELSVAGVEPTGRLRLVWASKSAVLPQ